MIWKALYLGLLAAWLLPGNVAGAENVLASDYRKIINSNSFYIEYSDETQNYIVAGRGEARAATMASQYYMDELDYYNGKKDYPNELYLKGKYYQFTDRRNAVMALEDQLDSLALDVRGRWNNIKNRLCIPEEFLPLVNRDPFRTYSNHYQPPVFLASGKEKVNKQELDYDKYTLLLKSHTGKVLSETHYIYYYDKKSLRRIDTFFVKKGKASKLGSIKIKQISQNPPEKNFTLPKGCKVTAVGTGDMNDLLDQRIIVESY